jgi:hypothetical protein
LSLEPWERGFEENTGFWGGWDVSRCLMGCGNYDEGWNLSGPFLKDEQWEPVVRLGRQLSSLSDLFWVCPEHLPSSLLLVLHGKPRLCRLHHCTLNLSYRTPGSITSYERDLLESSCLCTIGDMEQRYGNSALSLARILRSPSVRRTFIRTSDDEVKTNDNNLSMCKHVREFIQLDGPPFLDSVPFAKVHREASGNFSALRVLRLNKVIHPLELPHPSDFPVLATLAFTCQRDGSLTQQDWDVLSAFLRNLPRLDTLEVSDWDMAIPFAPALNPNLRIFDLFTQGTEAIGDACLRDDHIHALADVCPNTQELTIDIRRTRGDAAEIARYRSLGHLARLRELNLNLDVSPPGLIQADADHNTAIEPWFDQQDAKYLPGHLSPYREGHVRDLLVNKAIDESLARSIFHLINDAKPISTGQPLEMLKLSVFGEDALRYGPDGNSSPFSTLLLALEPRWELRRDVRDDARNVIPANEFGCTVDPDFYRMYYSENEPGNKYWSDIWRRVWPVERRRHGWDWWDDWNSFPLAVDTGAGVETGPQVI